MFRHSRHWRHGYSRIADQHINLSTAVTEDLLAGLSNALQIGEIGFNKRDLCRSLGSDGVGFGNDGLRSCGGSTGEDNLRGRMGDEVEDGCLATTRGACGVKSERHSWLLRL